MLSFFGASMAMTAIITEKKNGNKDCGFFSAIFATFILT